MYTNEGLGTDQYMQKTLTIDFYTRGSYYLCLQKKVVTFPFVFELAFSQISPNLEREMEHHSQQDIRIKRGISVTIKYSKNIAIAKI